MNGREIMSSAADYNQQAMGKLWGIYDLPKNFSGYQILLKGEQEQDSGQDPTSPDHVDWLAFSQAVRDFQAQAGLIPEDGKLGPETLTRLQASPGGAPAGPDTLNRLGDLAFHPATVPVSPPPGPPLVGRTPEQSRLCSLWNHYGAAIYHQAETYGLPVETALAVFAVESGTAYDPRTGLVIIRFEPAVFRRKTGQSIAYSRGGQHHEWQNLTRAYAVDPEAALWSTSYGLPQLMGFNWQVTGHASLAATVLAFQDSCVAQVAGFFGFVEHNDLVRFIKNTAWREFTRRYNGPGNVEAYSSRLIHSLSIAQTLKANGARFEG
jgi:hypothetical protein